MAKYRYKPYRRRKSTMKNRNMRFFALAVIVIIVVFIMLLKSRDKGTDSIKVTETTKDVPKPPQFKPDLKPKLKPALIVKLEPKPAEDIKSGTSDIIEGSTIDTGSGQIIFAETDALIKDARDDIDSGRIIAARDKLNQVLSMQISPQTINGVKKDLANLSTKWLFDRDHYPDDTLTSTYQVQPNDRLVDIGRKFKIPYEILMTINDIKRPESLRAGELIKVVHGPFHGIIHRSTFTMDLYLGNTTYVKTYRVGLGTADKETPTGRWRVKTDGKLVRPPWPNPEGGIVQPDDPEYPLGSRWIGLEGLEGNATGRAGFALHGTKDPETIGVRSSQGCIRLFNGDVIEVYNMFMPGFSEVLIHD